MDSLIAAAARALAAGGLLAHCGFFCPGSITDLRKWTNSVPSPWNRLIFQPNFAKLSGDAALMRK